MTCLSLSGPVDIMDTDQRRKRREQELSDAIGEAADEHAISEARRRLEEMERRGLGRPSYDLESPHGSGMLRFHYPN